MPVLTGARGDFVKENYLWLTLVKSICRDVVTTVTKLLLGSLSSRN